MSPKKVSAKDSGDKKKKLITIEVKKEIIKKHERGVRVVDLAQQYDRTTSTICTILKKKDEIKAVTPAKGVSRLSKQRTNIHEEMEKLLLIWINEKQLAGITLSETNIAEKARVLYGDLQKQYPGTSKQETSAEEFKASRGWFENFKKRTGVHSVVRHGEATSSNIKAAEEVLSPPLLAGEGYVSQQMFNCDETGLFWKKMPRRTYITAEEENTFCANASGEHKEELTTEELQLLQELQYTDAVEDIEGSAKKESVSEVVPTSVIKEVLAMWQTVQDFVEKYHPQKLSACRAAALFNDNGVDYFRGILKSRTKQISLDRFLNKRPASAESETSEAKSAKVPKSANNTCKERTPEIILPDVLMEGDFPYKH